MKKENTSMRLLSILLSLLMVFSMIPVASVFAEAQDAPDAIVSELGPMTLTAAEHDYMVWPSGDDTVDRPLNVVVNFKTNETLEEAQAGKYAKWKTDFYLKVEGLAGDSIIADDCYLAGNYGEYPWIVIPTDGFVLEKGVEYPIVSNYDSNLTYENICDYVKDFTAAIYISDAILAANPDFKVTLALKMVNPENENDVLTVGEPIVYDVDELQGLPNAIVTELAPMTLTANGYKVWQGGSNLVDGTEDLALDAVVNFKTEDTLAYAQASKYAKWKTDFYLKVEGLASSSITADDCYLAGNYGEYPWIVISTDGFELKEGIEYPIVSNYDPNLTYENICDYVKDFTAAIRISDDILEANPDFKVTLTLKMVNPEDENDVLVLDEPVVYTASKLQGLPNAIVTELDPMTLLANGYKVWQGGSNLADGTEDLALEAVVNFKTEDTLAYAQASKYAKWKTDFYLKVEGLAGDSIIADDCYLAGNYGEYPWIVIPTDGLEIKEGEEYPVVSNYDPNLTYENICDYVKDFTAAIYIADDIVKANPDLKITLTLKMVNPDDENDVLVLDEPVVYTIAKVKGLPNAIVTELEPITLPADGHKVWEGGNNLSNGTEDLPLDIVVNFKTNDTLEYAKASKYAKWKTDFYLTFTGLETDTISGDGSYLAGNYGEYPWIVIETDGLEIKEGEEYPVVSNYDPNLTYENICDYVKNFTAAIYINRDVISANPNGQVQLTLKLTNPNDENDVYVVDEPVVYTFDDFTAVAVNEETGKKYADLTLALNEAANKNQTVRVLKDIDLGNVSSLMVPAGVVLDINGKTIKSNMFMMLASFGDIIDSTQGEGGICISNTTAYTVLSTNTYLPIYDSANGCYRFFKYNVITKGAQLVDNDSNRLKFGYKLEIESKKAYELLANDAANTGLELTVGLTVNKGDGKPSTFQYKCSSSVLKNYSAYILNNYDDFASGEKQTSVTFKVAGLDKLPSGTVITSVPTFGSPKTQVSKSGDSISYTK